MSAGDLRVELTIAANKDGVSIPATGQTTGAKPWEVSDVKLMLEYVELNSEAARMISQQNSGG